MSEIKTLEQLEEREQLLRMEWEIDLRELDSLRSDHAASQAELTDLLVGLTLGEAKAAAVKSARDKTAAIGQKVADKEQLTAAIGDRLQAHKAEYKALKLVVNEKRYRELVPEIDSLADEYLVLRSQVIEISQEYNKKRLEAGLIKTTLNGATIPHYKNLSWRSGKVRINEDLLMGETPWA